MTTASMELRDSGVRWIGRVRSDWDVLRGKALFAARNERSREDDVHLTPSQQYGVLPQAEFMEITGAKVVLNLTGADNMKHVEPDDFVIHLRSFQGGIEHSRHRGKISMAYTVLTPRPGVLPAFYRWVLKSPSYIQALRSTTNQLRDGQSIKYGQFGDIPLPVPPPEEQRAVANFLDQETTQIDAMVDAQERLVALLEERRTALIKEAVTRGIDPAAPMRISGIPWLHQIPEHWFSGALRHFTEFTTGSTPSTEIAEHFEGDNLWANISDIKGGTIFDTAKRVSDEAFADRRMMLSMPGDLLFSFKLSVGSVAMVGAPMYTNEAIATFRDSEALRARYAYYALPIYVPENANVNIYGAKLLNSSLIRSAPVAVPPIPEQDRIVAYLDSATARTEAMIAKARESIALMKERRAAVISAAVTGRIDVRTGIEQVERDLEEARV